MGGGASVHHAVTRGAVYLADSLLEMELQFFCDVMIHRIVNKELIKSFTESQNFREWRRL